MEQHPTKETVKEIASQITEIHLDRLSIS